MSLFIVIEINISNRRLIVRALCFCKTIHPQGQTEQNLMQLYNILTKWKILAPLLWDNTFAKRLYFDV